jgi:hypothetical protein
VSFAIALALSDARPAGQVLLATPATTIENAAAPQARATLPTGLGPILILELWIQAGNFATLVANPELLGPVAFIYDSTVTTLRDVIGSCRWTRTGNELTATFAPTPDQPVYMEQADVLVVNFLEVDTNAAPTSQLYIYARVRRLRPD